MPLPREFEKLDIDYEFCFQKLTAVGDVYCDGIRMYVKISVTKSSVLACSPADLKIFGLSPGAECGFIVINTERSTIILGGSAFTDTVTVKRALAALAAPSILSRGALPLSAR